MRAYGPACNVLPPTVWAREEVFISKWNCISTLNPRNGFIGDLRLRSNFAATPFESIRAAPLTSKVTTGNSSIDPLTATSITDGDISSENSPWTAYQVKKVSLPLAFICRYGSFAPVEPMGLPEILIVRSVPPPGIVTTLLGRV